MNQSALLIRLDEQMDGIETRYRAMSDVERLHFSALLYKIMAEVATLFPSPSADEARTIVGQERQFVTRSLSNPIEAWSHSIMAVFYECVAIGPDAQSIADRCLTIMDDAETTMNSIREQVVADTPPVEVQASPPPSQREQQDQPDFTQLLRNIIAAFDADKDTYSPVILFRSLSEGIRNNLTIGEIERADLVLAKTYLFCRMREVEPPEEWHEYSYIEGFYEEVVQQIGEEADDSKRLGLAYFLLYLYCLKHRNSQADYEFDRVSGMIEKIIRGWCKTDVTPSFNCFSSSQLDKPLVK